MESAKPPNQQQKTSQNRFISFLSPQFPSIHSVQSPNITPEILQEPILTRITLSLMYFILLLEYKLSPSGRLRAWFKLNLLIMLWIAIPTLMILPFLTTCLLTFGEMTESLGVIAYNMMSACIPVFVIVGVLVLLYRLLIK